MSNNGKRVAWVTGGGSGIGESVAEFLAADGWIVVISGRRKEELERVVASITNTSMGPLDEAGKSEAWNLMYWSPSANQQVNISTFRGMFNCYAMPGAAGRLPSLKPGFFTDGAKLVESADDVLEELGPLVEPTLRADGQKIHHPAELQLNEIEQAVLQAIQSDPTQLDQVARTLPALREVGFDGPVLEEFRAVVENAAELPFLDELLGERDRGDAAVVVPHHVRHAGLLDRRDHLAALRGVHRQRLFAQNRLLVGRRS